jgi:hypothetical protein
MASNPRTPLGATGPLLGAYGTRAEAVAAGPGAVARGAFGNVRGKPPAFLVDELQRSDGMIVFGLWRAATVSP